MCLRLEHPAVVLLIAALSVVGAACGSGGEVGMPAAADTTAANELMAPSDESFEVVLQGMLTDTLSGQATFGQVFDPKTRQRQFVISLKSGSDVTSGFYITRSGGEMPTSQTYDITSEQGDTLAGGSAFSIVYREGMRRQLSSQSGTVTFSTVTDTLIEGRFEAVLRGEVSLPGRPPQSGPLNARGSFRADSASVGFIFGI